MKKSASIAEAKAHLSELVNLAERRKRATYITRRGLPVAAIVPIEVVEKPSRPRGLTKEQIDALFAGLTGLEAGALQDLLESRH